MRPREAINRLFGWFRWQSHEQELDEEIRTHIEMATEENIRRGMSPQEARQAARRSFGVMGPMKEEHRDARGLPLLESVLQDLRFALRAFRRRPGVAASAIVTLGLGIGGCTVLFSAVNKVLWEPLPVKEQGRLVMLYGTRDNEGADRVGVSPLSFTRWRERNESFEELAAISWWQQVQFIAGEEPFLGGLGTVTSNLFRFFGYEPVLGRDLQIEDERLDGPLVVTISRRAWLKHFGGDPDTLGKQVRLSTVNTPGYGLGHTNETGLYTIVGVMPDLPGNVIWGQYDAWTSLRLDPAMQRAYLQVFGRLKPGVQFDQAREEMNTIAAGIPEEVNHPQGRGVNPVPLTDEVIGQLRPRLILLSAAVGLLLLATCANIATLLLGQVRRREEEFSIRATLGAGRTRVIRQMLTENFTLSLAGGAAGCLVAWWCLQALEIIGPTWWRNDWDIRLSPASLLFVFSVCCLTTLLLGLPPALAVGRRTIYRSLGARGLGNSNRHSQSVGQGLLVATQTAVALALLIGAALIFQSSLNAMGDLKQGLRLHSVYDIPLELPRLYSGERSNSFFREVLEQTESLPGVSSAGLVQSVPPATTWQSSYRKAGTPVPEPDEPIEPTLRNNVSAGYFQTLGIPLVRGRLLDERDRLRTPVPVLVNEAMARRLWEGENPIGQLLYSRRETDKPYEVVGIVGNVSNHGLAGARPEIYFHYSRQANTNIHLLAHFNGSEDALLVAVRDVIRSVDDTVPVEAVTPLEKNFEQLLQHRTFMAILMITFSCFALALAAFGIWGVVACAVSRRTREIGLRLALGAEPHQVVTESMRKGIGWSVVGIVAGMGAALGMHRLLANELHGVEPTDPLTFVAAGAVLVLLMLASSYLPARRAAHVDPMQSLRHE